MIGMTAPRDLAAIMLLAAFAISLVSPIVSGRMDDVRVSLEDAKHFGSLGGNKVERDCHNVYPMSKQTRKTQRDENNIYAKQSP
jgi:hypothetical protein